MEEIPYAGILHIHKFTNETEQRSPARNRKRMNPLRLKAQHFIDYVVANTSQTTFNEHEHEQRPNEYKANEKGERKRFCVLHMIQKSPR